jgi:chromate transport protein ChrA
VSQRLRRAAVALGLAAALALVALPIPLVHFVLVPAALLLGLIFAALRLNQREIIRSAEGSCPYCSTHQRLGLAGRVFRLPREVFCSRCGRPLDLDRD